MNKKIQTILDTFVPESINYDEQVLKYIEFNAFKKAFVSFIHSLSSEEMKILTDGNTKNINSISSEELFEMEFEDRSMFEKYLKIFVPEYNFIIYEEKKLIFSDYLHNMNDDEIENLYNESLERIQLD